MGQTSMLMAVAAVILGGLTGSAGSAFTVAVRGGKPDCPIVLPASPKPTEVRAAEELQDYVGRITGVRLAIERGTAPAKGGEVFRAGVYDPVAKRNVVRDFCIRDTDVKTAGYAWYDLFLWEPKGQEFFWLSPGVYDHKKLDRNEAFTALAVDRIELTRE